MTLTNFGTRCDTRHTSIRRSRSQCLRMRDSSPIPTARCFTSIALATLLGAMPCAIAQRPDPPFAIIELDKFFGLTSSFHGINDRGWFTGWSGGPVIGRHTHLMPIEPPAGADGASGQLINNVGQVAMHHYDPTSYQRGALWDPSTHIAVDLGSLGGNRLYVKGLNELGQVVGFDNRSDDLTRAYLWDNGVMTDLGDLDPLGDRYSGAYDINDARQIVGFAGDASLNTLAFIWEDGQMRALSTWANRYATAYGVNNHGEAVGLISNTAAFWDANGQYQILRSEFTISDDVDARYINDNGIIVGRVDEWLGEYGPVIWWDRFDTGHWLHSELPPRHQWELDRIDDLNNHGQMVGNGEHEGSGSIYYQDFIITPIHPTFDLRDVSPGQAGHVNFIRASGVAPGTRVYFIYGTQGGGTYIPGCTALQNVLQIENAKLAGSAVANRLGVATLSGTIPASAAWETYLFQAVIPDECAISNLVVQRITQ